VLIYAPLVVMLVGVVVYLLVEKQGKVAEVGRIMFAFGLLVVLLMIRNGKPFPL
jgi:hypothetical protein